MMAINSPQSCFAHVSTSFTVLLSVLLLFSVSSSFYPTSQPQNMAKISSIFPSFSLTAFASPASSEEECSRAIFNLKHQLQALSEAKGKLEKEYDENLSSANKRCNFNEHMYQKTLSDLQILEEKTRELEEANARYLLQSSESAEKLEEMAKGACHSACVQDGELSRKYESLEADYVKVKTEAERVSEEAERAKATFDSLKAEADTLKASMAEIEQQGIEKAASDAEKDALLIEQEAKIREIEGRLEETVSKLRADKEAEITKKNELVEARAAEVRTLQERLAKRKQEVDETKELVTLQDEELKMMKSSLQEVSKARKELEGKMGDMKTELAERNKEVTELSAANNKMKVMLDDYKTLSSARKELELQNEDLKGKLVNHQRNAAEKLESMKKRFEDVEFSLHNRLNESNEELSKLQGELDKHLTQSYLFSLDAGIELVMNFCKWYNSVFIFIGNNVKRNPSLVQLMMLFNVGVSRVEALSTDSLARIEDMLNSYPYYRQLSSIALDYWDLLKKHVKTAYFLDILPASEKALVYSKEQILQLNLATKSDGFFQALNAQLDPYFEAFLIEFPDLASIISPNIYERLILIVLSILVLTTTITVVYSVVKTLMVLLLWPFSFLFFSKKALEKDISDETTSATRFAGAAETPSYEASLDNLEGFGGRQRMAGQDKQAENANVFSGNSKKARGVSKKQKRVQAKAVEVEDM